MSILKLFVNESAEVYFLETRPPAFLDGYFAILMRLGGAGNSKNYPKMIPYQQKGYFSTGKYGENKGNHDYSKIKSQEEIMLMEIFIWL